MIREEDVPHLGRPQAVQQLDAEGLLPAMVERRRESLSGGERLDNTPDLPITYISARVKGAWRIISSPQASRSSNPWALE